MSPRHITPRVAGNLAIVYLGWGSTYLAIRLMVRTISRDRPPERALAPAAAARSARAGRGVTRRRDRTLAAAVRDDGAVHGGGDKAGRLRPGLAREETFDVDGLLLTDVRGSLPAPVLSTPAMIGMMERCAATLAAEALPDGKVTVGFEVCVKHVAAAAKGARCTTRVRLREVVDARKLRFDVEVVEGERTIGVGTHERRVIDTPNG